jgi:hypothetical protein
MVFVLAHFCKDKKRLMKFNVKTMDFYLVNTSAIIYVPASIIDRVSTALRYCYFAPPYVQLLLSYSTTLLGYI